MGDSRRLPADVIVHCILVHRVVYIGDGCPQGEDAASDVNSLYGYFHRDPHRRAHLLYGAVCVNPPNVPTARGLPMPRCRALTLVSSTIMGHKNSSQPIVAMLRDAVRSNRQLEEVTWCHVFYGNMPGPTFVSTLVHKIAVKRGRVSRIEIYSPTDMWKEDDIRGILSVSERRPQYGPLNGVVPRGCLIVHRNWFATDEERAFWAEGGRQVEVDNG